MTEEGDIIQYKRTRRGRKKDPHPSVIGVMRGFDDEPDEAPASDEAPKGKAEAADNGGDHDD